MGRISLVLTDLMCRSESLTQLLGRSYSPTAIKRQFSNTLNQTRNKEALGGKQVLNYFKGSVLPTCHSRGLTYQHIDSVRTPPLFLSKCCNSMLCKLQRLTISKRFKHLSIFIIIPTLRVQSSNARLSNQAFWSCAIAKCPSTGFGREPKGHIITPTLHAR